LPPIAKSIYWCAIAVPSTTIIPVCELGAVRDTAGLINRPTSQRNPKA